SISPALSASCARAFVSCGPSCLDDASATPLEDTEMAVPRRKTSPSRRGIRRSADALKKPTYVEDKDSGELRRPHHLDLKTGMYKGRQILNAKAEAGCSRRRVVGRAHGVIVGCQSRQKPQS